MDERMTLERLVHEYRPTMDSEVLHSWAADMAAAVTAHLTQPAQAVDVDRLGEIVRRAEKVVGSRGVRFELRFEPLSGRGRDLIDYIDAALTEKGNG